MLLEKIVKGDIVTGIYKSSNILMSEYDKTKDELTVIFNNGGKYMYTNVPKTDVVRFEMAESQGKVLNSHIKKYPFVNLGKVDTKEILENINKAKINRLKEYQEIIITAFKDMGSDWDTNETFFDSKLNKIKDFIKNYEENKE